MSVLCKAKIVFVNLDKEQRTLEQGLDLVIL